ncbi:hypothetical protein LOAG_11810 [Loa loa]|uniref:Uncharacterized protein n=1 Tax=Loa loa TaxID=7209 RepID=A0A1S0TMC9_LOALO|nr:hypothetical protein LOAG_11810 [Loa loa]EFO16692.2 hypothetical protein LOAG_11810 [Loa loa]
MEILFRSVATLCNQSRDHAAGPQTLTLDFHFSDRSTAGPSRGSRIAQSTHSTFSSKQNIPKIGLLPHERLLRENKPVPNSISSVSSAENELTRSSPNCFPQFTLHGSDFPRLRKSTQISEASNSSQDNKIVVEPQRLITENSAKNASNPSEPNGVSSRSWFIDDDEQFPSHRQHPGTLNKQQAQNREMGNFAKDRDVKTSSETTAIELSWCKAMKKPMSLSNVASALAPSDFPSLSASAVAKPVSNLLPGSVWAKKCRSVMQTPSGQMNLSSSTSTAGNISRKNKQLPLPDLWPQESVPERWEDREDSSTLESLSKMTLEDMVVVKDTSAKCKKTKNKQQHNFVKKLNNQFSEGRKTKVEDKIVDEFVDPFPSLPSHARHESEAEEACATKPSFNLSELLSSAFSVPSNIKKEDKNEAAETTAIDPVNEATNDASSFKAFSELGERSKGKISNKQSEIIEKYLPAGFGSPPGLCSMNLAPPPGFGPPPGFDNTLCPKMQTSLSDVVKSSDENVNVSVSKAVKHGNKKKGKK